MKKAVIRHTTVCLATTVVLCTSSILNTKAISFTGETGVAGIELSLDDNNTARNVVSDSEVVNVLAARTMSEEATTEESEETTEDTSKEVEDTTEEDSQEEKEEEPVSEYANVGISIAPTYVNVRKKANTDSKIMGKLYKGCAATILETKGDWVKIKSGNVKGYIKSEYLAIGFDAEELVEKYGTKIATVTTTTLNVREKKSTDSKILTMIPVGESYVVLKEYDEWIKVSIDGGSDDSEDDGVVGYVSKEYVDITVEFETAISIEEEQAKLKAEEEARKAEEEQAAKLQREQEEQRQQSSNNNSNNNSSSNNSSNSSNNSNKSNSNNSNSSSNSSNNSSETQVVKGSGTGSDIANYALKFVGNPYVYGGTSLTNGADCSGFVMSVYKSFGYSLPRTSSAQSGAGVHVDLSALQPGDLVFYTGGTGHVNHVAIYIGGGRVVHASNPRSGIKTSSVNYRTPYTARRIVR